MPESFIKLFLKRAFAPIRLHSLKLVALRANAHPMTFVVSEARATSEIESIRTNLFKVTNKFFAVVFLLQIIIFANSNAATTGPFGSEADPSIVYPFGLLPANNATNIINAFGCSFRTHPSQWWLATSLLRHLLDFASIVITD